MNHFLQGGGLVFGLGLTLFPLDLHSQQTTQGIGFGSSFDFENVITSDGSALLLADFSFELGSFGAFEPTADNLDEWVDNWKVFDAISPNSPDGGDAFFAGTSPTAIFGSAAELRDDRTSSSDDALPTSTFNAGEQGYVFVRNGDTPEVGTEWLLYTSLEEPAWLFPGSFSEELQWFLSNVDEVVWGAVNDGDVIGGGSFTDGTSEFAIRSHGFEAVAGEKVPEVSTATFCLFALSSLFWRRRSRQA